PTFIPVYLCPSNSLNSLYETAGSLFGSRLRVVFDFLSPFFIGGLLWRATEAQGLDRGEPCPQSATWLLNKSRHSRGKRESRSNCRSGPPWIPAFAGMT